MVPPDDAIFQHEIFMQSQNLEKIFHEIFMNYRCETKSDAPFWEKNQKR